MGLDGPRQQEIVERERVDRTALLAPDVQLASSGVDVAKAGVPPAADRLPAVAVDGRLIDGPLAHDGYSSTGLSITSPSGQTSAIGGTGVPMCSSAARWSSDRSFG